MSKKTTPSGKSHEVAVKAVTFTIFIIGMIYVGYANEILKGKVSDVHRFILCVVFIYGAFRLSSDMTLLIYKKIFK